MMTFMLKTGDDDSNTKNNMALYHSQFLAQEEVQAGMFVNKAGDETHLVASYLFTPEHLRPTRSPNQVYYVHH